MTLTPDRAEILRSLKLLVATGDIFEVRAIKTRKATVSGYSNDLEIAADLAFDLNDDPHVAAPAVYVTLNPCSPDLLARAVNQLKPFAQVTTQDAEIVCRRWLLIDFDPTRPAGISATNQEHELALARAASCREWLSGQGWPMPVTADSGNGGHLLYRVNMANDAASTELIKRVLQALAAKFDDALVTVDQSVFNASRITKVYGTVTRKGDSMPERPHRLARVLWNGQATYEIVPREQLQAVADQVLDEIKPRPVNVTKSENVLELLTAWGLKVIRSEEHQGQEEAGIMHTLAACPHNDTHRNAVVFEYPESGRTVFNCLHASCKGRGWKELRAKFEPWRQAIIRNEKGAPRPLLANAIAMLENDSAWAGVLGFDEFARMTVVQSPTPWPQGEVGRSWSDFDDSQACAWLQSKGLHVGTPMVAEAIQVIAQKNRFHPLQNYLKSLEWDGKNRLDSWLHDYMSVPLNAYSRAVGPRWMISAIARALEPGVQADCALVALAGQGKLKSTAFRTLAVRDCWFSDSIDTLGDRDSRERLRGLWIVELSELSALRRSELEHVKSFLSCRVDHYRPAYGRRSIDVPRSCVFCGTSNDESPFVDSTGNRRFWPVRTGKIDLAALTQDRDFLCFSLCPVARFPRMPYLESGSDRLGMNYVANQRFRPVAWHKTRRSCR